MAEIVNLTGSSHYGFGREVRYLDGVNAETVTADATITALTGNYLILSGGSANVDLPAEADSDGKWHLIKNAGTGIYTVRDDGGTTIATLGNGDWVHVACDGTSWYAVATGTRTAQSTATAITAVTVLTLADAGGVFTVAQSSAYDIDLPSPTTGAGKRYLFQLVSPGAFNVTITVAGAAATFEGTIVNDVTSVVPATGATLTFASGVAFLGDTIEAISTSTGKYLVRAVSSAAGGITIA